MCEPYHSIVQYSVDDSDDSTGQGGTTSNRLQWGLGKIFDWGKKIGSWFHFSKLGSGHTESIEWAKTRHLYLPEEIRYEGVWWNRQVKLDMPFATAEKEMLQAATQYCNVVVIGSIGKFRRFFETSIEKTDRPVIYYTQFIEGMLTSLGRQKVFTQIRRVFGAHMRFEKIPKEQMTKLLLGYTRKRNLLVPEWSDVDNLWVTQHNRG